MKTIKHSLWMLAIGVTTVVLGSFALLHRAAAQVEARNAHPAQDSWLETILLASDGSSQDAFGRSVAIYEGSILVGAPDDDDRGTDSGSTYLFRQVGTNWIEDSKLTASDGMAYDSFGSAVALDENVLLVGAPQDTVNTDGPGIAYVFRRGDSGWIQEAKLIASDAAANDQFGYAVAIQGNVALIGAPFEDGYGSNSGATYVFRWNGINWIEEARLTASDASYDDAFGYAVSLDGDVALIGASFEDGQADASGAAYVFRWDGTSWNQEAKLAASDGAYNRRFGESVSLSQDTALIGTYTVPDPSAYVFRWNGISWLEETILIPDDWDTGTFGSSVSIDGDLALIGNCHDNDNGENSGSAYLFRWNGSNWVEDTKLLASDGEYNSQFGFAVVLSNHMSVIGVPSHDGNGYSSGAAYVFQKVEVGSGIFVDSNQSLGNSGEDLALGDVDNDGDLDIFLARGFGVSGPNEVWLNSGGAQGGIPGTYSNSGQSLGNADSRAVKLGDLNGDGYLDAFVGHVGYETNVWFNDGAGSFIDSGQHLAATSTFDIALGDVDEDNDLDAILVYWTDGVPDEVWLNNGQGYFGPGQDLEAAYTASVALGDLDGDSDLDVFIGNGGGGNTVWFNQGGAQGGAPGTFAKSLQSLGDESTMDVALGDVDGDDDLDAYVGNRTSYGIGPNEIWLNDGSGIFTDSGQSLGISNNTYAVALGDIDGDGDLDAFDGNWNGPNKVWTNNGGLQGGTLGIFSDSGQNLGNLSTASVGLGDVDGDTDLDAVVGSCCQSSNQLWLNVDDDGLVVNDLDYRVQYDGWRGGESPTAIGGGYRAASSYGQRITYQTAESADNVSLFVCRGPDQGLAYILMDDVFQGVLDLYAPVDHCGDEVVYGGLTPTLHTISFFASGQKNPLSTGTEVRLDGFQVADNFIDDKQPEIGYGNWFGRTLTDVYLGSVRVAARANATVRLQVNGPEFTWTTIHCPYCGQARVIVDGQEVAIVDTYAANWQFQQPQVFSGLGEEEHTVYIRVLGAHHPFSNGNLIFFDGYTVP